MSDISRGLRNIRSLLADPHAGNIEAASVVVDDLCADLGIAQSKAPSPDELTLWLSAVGAYAVAFGSVRAAVEKATEIVLTLRELDPVDLPPEVAEMVRMARGGR